MSMFNTLQESWALFIYKMLCSEVCKTMNMTYCKIKFIEHAKPCHPLTSVLKGECDWCSERFTTVKKLGHHTDRLHAITTSDWGIGVFWAPILCIKNHPYQFERDKSKHR